MSSIRLLIALWCSAKTRKINLMVHYVLFLLRSEAEMRLSHKRNRKKWKRSDSSDSDYVALMTLLTTPILITCVDGVSARICRAE